MPNENMDAQIFEIMKRLEKLEKEVHKNNLLLMISSPVISEQERQNAAYELAQIREKEQQSQDLGNSFR